MRCQRCGTDNPAEYRFCGDCGTPLSSAPAVDDVWMDDSAPPSPRRRDHRPIFLVAGVALAGTAAVACIACLALFWFIQPFSIPASTTQAKPAATSTVARNSKIANIGEPIAGGNWVYTVTQVDQVKTIPLASGDKRDAKGAWVIIYLTLNNTAKENQPYRETDFGLVDAANKEYKPSSGFYVKTFLSDHQLRLFGEEIKPGAVVDTALVFDVAADAKGFQLLLKQANRAVALGR